MTADAMARSAAKARTRRRSLPSICRYGPILVRQDILLEKYFNAANLQNLKCLKELDFGDFVSPNIRPHKHIVSVKSFLFLPQLYFPVAGSWTTKKNGHHKFHNRP